MLKVFTRRLLRLGALSGLGAMLFAQAALALAACNVAQQPSPSAALAMSVAQEAGSDCHEAEPSDNALCVAHCQVSGPSLDKTPAQPAVAPLLTLAPVPWRAALPHVVAPAFAREAPPAASPPARILFQTLLI